MKISCKERFHLISLESFFMVIAGSFFLFFFFPLYFVAEVFW